jgi:hypothetical protein
MPALPPAPAAGGRGVTDFGAGWPVVGPAGRRKAGWQEQALAAFDFADLRAKRHQKLRAAMDGP